MIVCVCTIKKTMCLEKKTRALDAWANTKVCIYAYYAPVDKIVKVLRSLQKKNVKLAWSPAQ